MREVPGRAGMVDGLVQDARLAARGLARSPGLVVAATLTLGLGLGAATLIFSLINALFLRPLPGAAPHELAAVYTSDYGGDAHGGTSYPDFVDLRAQSRAFAGWLAFAPTPVSLSHDAEAPERVVAEWVTPDAFDVLGLPPALGRGLRAADDDAPDVALVSDALWRRRFSADPGLIGRGVRVNGRPVTVVGVAPRGFRGLMRGLEVDLWLPLRARAAGGSDDDRLTSRGARGLMVMARLAPGVDARQAQAELHLAAARQLAAHPSEWTDLEGRGRRLTLRAESRARVFPAAQGPLAAFLGLLMGGAALVLVVACSNLAGLLLARASARRREIGTRLALGASRARLLRQLLAESMLLGLPGGALGVLLAAWGAQALAAFRPPLPVPIHLDVSLDPRVLAFGFLATTLTGLLIGLLPALQSTRADLLPALREGGGALGGARGLRLRRALVVAQVAVSLVLLGSAGLFLRSLARAGSLDLGFDTRGVLLVPLDLALIDLPAHQARELHARALERAAALPGVTAASLTTIVPLSLDGSRSGVTVDGYAPREGEDMEVASAAVGPGYFETLRLPLLRGRDVSSGDVAGGPGVALVNETFARRYWPGLDPLGRRLSFGGAEGPWLEVVGLARDSKYVTLGEEPRPFIYTALLQGEEISATLLLRAARGEAALAPAARAALLDLDRRLPVFEAHSFESHLGVALLPARAAGLLLGLIGALALALSALGLYALLAWSVARRTRELGLRQALGASQADVRALVVRQGLGPVVLGASLGLTATLALGRLLRGFLYGISPTDGLALGGATLLLLVTALVACLLPAHRAANVAPASALRAE